MKKASKILALALTVVFVLSASMLVASAEAADSAEISFGEVATLDPGDINKDTVTNLLDLVRLKKYLANAALGDENPVVINTVDKCDLDDDGEIDAPDAVQLKKLLLGVNIFEQLDAE